MTFVANAKRLTLLAACQLLALPGHAQDPAPVEAVMPERSQSQRTLELSGSLTPRRAASLSPRVPGLVAEILVDAGDPVARGGVLLRLDDQLAKLAVAEAAAAVEESRATLAEARRRRDEAERLVEDNYVSRTEIEAMNAQVAIAEAAVARQDAMAATARARLERHSVIAPFDGVISRKMTEAGEWVETGAVIAELVGTRELWVDVRAPQEYWGELRPDTAVSVVLDAQPGRTIDAVVHARVPVNDPSARTFLVRLLLEDIDDPAMITPGMSARARFTLDGGNEILRVPRDALIRYPDGTTTLWVVEEDGGTARAREIRVTVGRTDGDRVEIVSDLEPLRPVIVRGNENLTEDRVVRVTDDS